MLIFLDTEWTDPINCDLVSIGMVCQDGTRELYAERSDYEDSWCNSFVRAAVLPQLGHAGPALDRPQLGILLAEWFTTLPHSVTVACDSFVDWELLLDALGDTRPANLAGRYDLRPLVDSEAFHHAVVAYHEQGWPWHHALFDARAHRHGWLTWSDNQKKKSVLK